MDHIKVLIEKQDVEALKKLLDENPALANAEVGIPFDKYNKALDHPLHRICDPVISGQMKDEKAIEMAKLFLSYGANIEGFYGQPGKETPLIAAASLLAEKLGIFYIDSGANIFAVGNGGATALHWAAWVGRDKLVKKLIDAGAEINKECTEFESTPLLWAVHGYKTGGAQNRYHQIECVRLLLAAGADKNIPNKEGLKPIDFLTDEDEEFRKTLA